MLLSRSSTGVPVDQLPMSGEILFDTSQQNLATIVNSTDLATPQQLYPQATPPAATPGPTAVDAATWNWQETWELVEANPYYATATPQVPTSFLDTGLTPGKFYYYSLFVFSLEEATPAWRLAGQCVGLVATNYGYGDRLFELLPEAYRQQDAQFSDPTDPEGPLQRFLQVFGSQLDLVRTEQESLRLTRTPQRMAGGLLPLLANTLGTGYEGAIGMRQARYKLDNIVHLYKLKGTRLGVEGIVNAVTGWDCAVDVSYNMLYDKNTSSFFEPFVATPQATPATPQNPTIWRGRKVNVPGVGNVVRTTIDRVKNPYPDLDDLRPSKWINNIDVDIDGRIQIDIHMQVLRARRSTTVTVNVDDRIVVTHSEDGQGHMTAVKIRSSRTDHRFRWEWDDDRDRDHVRDHDDDDDICRHRHTRLVDIDRTRINVRIDEFARVEKRPPTLRSEGLEKRFFTPILSEGEGMIDERTITSKIRVGVTGQALVTHDVSNPSRQAHCYLDYYDYNGVFISSSPAGPSITTVAGTWKQVYVADPAPPDSAVFAALSIEWLSVTTVDIHYYKSVQIEIGCHRDDDDVEHLFLVPRVLHGQAPLTVTVVVGIRTPKYQSWRLKWGDGTPDLTGAGRVTGMSFTHTYMNQGNYRISFQGVERDGDLERGHCKVHVSGPTMIYSSDEGVSASNGTLTTLSPFALARDIRVRVAPTRANQVANPSFEVDTNLWTPMSDVNISRVAVPVANPEVPTSGFCLAASALPPPAATPQATTQPTLLNDIDVYTTLSVLPQTPYALSAYFLSSGEMRNVAVLVEYLDGQGNNLTKATWATYDHLVTWAALAGRTWESLEENWVSNDPAVDRSNQWVRASMVTVSPEMAKSARLHVLVEQPTPGLLHYIDAVLFERAADVEPYFDAAVLPGSPDYVWGGTPHASMSYWYPHRTTKNSRLNQVLGDFIPAGSTFSLVYGSDT